jgi:hypothetical protein
MPALGNILGRLPDYLAKLDYWFALRYRDQRNLVTYWDMPGCAQSQSIVNRLNGDCFSFEYRFRHGCNIVLQIQNNRIGFFALGNCVQLQFEPKNHFQLEAASAIAPMPEIFFKRS